MRYTNPILSLLKWMTLASVIGILSGTASAYFLHSLEWVTHSRQANSSLILGLPLIGVFMGWGYHKYGANAIFGNHLVVGEANERKNRIPLRMTPMVLTGTLLTHLFGGSAGREGTAVQMGASLADTVRRLLNLKSNDHRLVVMAGISAGFGSVFGVPFAGFIFGLEVQKVGRMRYNAVIPCLVSSILGDATAHYLQAPHARYPLLPQLDLDLFLIMKCVMAGIIFGLFSIIFIESLRFLKKTWTQITPHKWIHPLFGGLLIVGLAFLSGEQYLGLSLELIEESMKPQALDFWISPLKLLFTSITLSAGFLGGEVTPLFVIGSTLGSAISPLLGVDPVFLACMGLVAVFAGCANTPFTCIIMGIELFGGGSAIYLGVICFTSFFTSGHRGIYHTQRLWIDKRDPTGLPSKRTVK